MLTSPGWAEKDDVVAAATKSSVPRWAMVSRLSPRA